MENWFFRYKSVFGGGLKAMHNKGQRRKIAIGCHILNRMAELGRPKSYAVVSGTRDWESSPPHAGIESCNSAVCATHCSLNIPAFGRFTEHPLDGIMIDIWTVINSCSPVYWLQSSEKR